MSQYMIKNVVVVGGGVLGSQIAYQAAYRGFNVTIWLRDDGSIDITKPKIKTLHETYEKTLKFMMTPAGKTPYTFARGLAQDPNSFSDEVAKKCLKANDDALKNLKYEFDMAKAVKDADLVIEAVSENPNVKNSVFSQLAKCMPEKTILCTNSSTLLPSAFAEVTGRPAKFLALHFANNIWKSNTAEVMGHAGTDPKAFNEVVEFSKQLGMIPLPLHKEQPGYILNTMLVPFLSASMYLYAEDIADYQTVDLTWKLATGAPLGPFQIIDIVGLLTTYEIVSHKPGADDPKTPQGRVAKMLKTRIDQGKLGVGTGEGFYKYK